MKKFLIKLNKIQNNKNNGYAILFTIIIISVISAVTAGLSNSTFKQMILSSLARDSQIAFYQADTAADCAFYADLVKTEIEPDFFKNNERWLCGEYDLIIKYANDEFGSYTLSPDNNVLSSNNPCFSISVKKGNNTTEIDARGYNICNKTNPRVVERAILVNY